MRGSRPQPCQFADLSLGGCFVWTQRPAPAGTSVTLSIRLDGEETVSMAGTVVSDEWNHGFRVKFGRRTSVDVKVLESVMASLRANRKKLALVGG